MGRPEKNPIVRGDRFGSLSVVSLSVAADVNEVTFTLPSLPMSVNSLYNVLYSQRKVELKPECRRWKSESKQYVPRFKVSEGSSVAIHAIFHFPFHYKNGKPRIFDVANLLKLTIDMIAERCAFNDFLVRHGSWASVDDGNERVVVTLTEIMEVSAVVAPTVDVTP